MRSIVQASLFVSLLALTLAPAAIAADSHGAVSVDRHAEPAKKSSAEPSKDIAEQLRTAVENGDLRKKRLTLVSTGIDRKTAASDAHTPSAAPAHAAPPVLLAAATVNPQASRNYIRAKAAVLTGYTAPEPASDEHSHAPHWSYEGDGGPQAWGKLKPEFNTCATGKRQSPIHIEDALTLQGPAEAIQINYQPSNGVVVNNGHTIQVDVSGDNSITVRGSTYKLLQFHFHHPSEERINYKSYSMVAHLVHRNREGQLAVVGVLLDPGLANSLINKVWTYMPLDAGDSVRMPLGLVDLNELLPKDQRYYQFMGSLTTPPCTEGVLWMVLKQPVTLSRDQLKLFGQLFPNNARPVQSVNARAIREAQ
jgi:carbonic anhydrase